MRNATILTFTFALLFAGSAFAQQVDYSFEVPPTEEFTAPYTVGLHSGARSVAGPYDLDGDGKVEVIVADYTGGGRVHVIENAGLNTWELVYSTPVNDSTATTNNNRQAIGGDLDGDGNGEIMFLSGRNFSATNPNIGDLPVGLYVYEFTGTDDDYGSAPASIYTFPADVPDRWRTDQMEVTDVDGDGFQELLFGNNGGNNRYDNWYVLSVNGDIGSGFEAWVEEVRLSSRSSEDFDPVNRGGGSPYAIHAANLDGLPGLELSLHSWNNFNFTTGRALGADLYEFPAEASPNKNLQAAPNDHVSLFGGVVVDIDKNGDDEIFYPRFQTGDVSLLNYEPGEDVLQITTDNFILDLIPSLTSLGVTAGDLDGDGNLEVIGAGPAYGSGSFQRGDAPVWVRIAEFAGLDPEDPDSYEVTEVAFPQSRDALSFDRVVRDSAGVVTEYFEEGTQGPEFTAKLAYLGDPDDDNFREVALSFQGVDDTSYVFQEVFNPADSTYTRTTQSATPNTKRTFLRVLSSDGLVVSIEDDRVVVPSDYVLSPNYPNPFNPSTSFTFTLPLDKRVSVKVYDLMGRLVRTLVDGEFYAAGTHQVTWDGTNQAGAQVASGTYLYTLEYGTFRQARKMLLVK